MVYLLDISIVGGISKRYDLIIIADSRTHNQTVNNMRVDVIVKNRFLKLSKEKKMNRI